MINYTELSVKVNLKQDIHFQNAPEKISDMLKKAAKIDNECFVYSNLGKADKDGFFKKKGMFKVRSFDFVLMEDFAKSLLDYEDEYFRVDFIMSSVKNFEKITSLYTLNPVFVKIENGFFWTFKSSGVIDEFVNNLQKDLLEKYELYFDEKLELKESFIKFMTFKNQKPFTYFKNGKRCFGYKVYIEPKDDEISQILSFIALSNGLGHLNEEVGGGFVNSLK